MRAASSRRISVALPVVVVAALAGCAAPLSPASVAEVADAPSDCLSSVGPLDLQRATIADLQAALASGAVTSVALVDAYLARIAAFDAGG
ncbi:MAG TPA: hypothetical protein VI997_09705, partial [Candidatus Thermoplasmatota archaeon]|nr:hypothetical protein [Candidatus Thermoplasmatota archaeon]